MTFFKPSRSDNDLSTYWNALVRNAPAEELARLARQVEPSEIAAIEQAHAAHERYEPDPMFARRLEQTLMDTATTMTGVVGTIPQPRVSPPSRNGYRDPGPVSRRRALAPSQRSGWPLRPALLIGLVILLVLASIGGLWWTFTTNRDDEPVRLMAPVVATPSPEASPGWSHFKGDAARSGRTNFGPVAQPVELWRYQAGDACNPSPAAVGDTVYMACNDGMLTALDAASGTVRWQFSAEPFVNGPSVADGVAYVIGDSGALYAVDTTSGTERWRVEGNTFGRSPAVAGDVLVAVTSDGVMVGIDTANGTERWQVQMIDAGVIGTPALADGIAYAGSESGSLVAVDVAKGEILWRSDTGTDIHGTATVDNGIVYISHSPGGDPAALFAFDAKTGELRWQRDEWMAAPSISGTIAVSGNENGDVVTFDLTTGEDLWRTKVGGELRPLPVSGEIVYVPSDGDRAIYAYDLRTGDPLWTIEVDGGMWDGPAVTDGRIYVATTFGVVQAFGEGESGSVAASPVASPVATPGDALMATPPASQSATAVAAQDIAVELAWQSTGGPDPLQYPNNGLAIAPDGTIWVMDAGNNRFQLLSPDGAYLETWGTAGEGDGQLDFNRSPGDPGNSVGDIAFAPDGSFYVADTANQRIQHFSADREFIGAWGSFGPGDGQFLDPFGVAVAPDGNVYVIDDQRDDVQVFDPEGMYLFTFAGHGTGPGQLNGTGSLAIDADGNVWVADFGNNRVQQFAADGTFIMSFGESGQAEGQFNFPADIAFDHSGNLYVTDLDNNRIQVFTPDGAFQAAWSAADDGQGTLSIPAGIAVDADGSVYVTQIEAGTVQKFDVTWHESPGATPVN